MFTTGFSPVPEPANAVKHAGMEMVGGYRLLRKLGEGERAEIWLGHAGRSEDVLAAIKLYRLETASASIDQEVEALARASHPHLLTLLDISTAPDGRPCPILPRLSTTSLGRVIADRSTLEVGELVTAAAPLTSAVAELHRVGVAHGRIDPASVLLDRRGAPVLAAFGKASLVGDFPADESGSSLTAVRRANEPRMVADLHALAALVSALASRTTTAPGLADFLVWLGSAEPDDGFLDRLSDRLFDLAPAVPLRRTDAPARMAAGLPARAVPVGEPVSSVAVATVRPRAGTVFAAVVARLRGRDRSMDPVAAFWTRVRQVAAPVRRPVWIAGAAGLVALLIALVLIPVTAKSDVPAATPSSVSTSGAGSSGPSGAGKTPDPAALDAPVIHGDDPVAAARVLIALRRKCIAALSALCLSRIEQSDSAALDADRYFLRLLQGGGTVKDRRLDETGAVLVERLGDSAIVGLGPETDTGYPASVLVVKTGAGWRIRDLTTVASP